MPAKKIVLESMNAMELLQFVQNQIEKRNKNRETNNIQAARWYVERRAEKAGMTPKDYMEHRIKDLKEDGTGKLNGKGARPQYTYEDLFVNYKARVYTRYKKTKITEQSESSDQNPAA